MGQEFSSLPDHLISFETIEQMGESNSIDEVVVVSMVPEKFLVSSFIARMTKLHAIGFSEKSEQWEIVETVAAGEPEAAFRSMVNWMAQENEFVEEFEYDFDQVDTLEDLGELLQDKGTEVMSQS